jgi:hypothetical protein
MMAISVDAGDVVALLALLLSGYATWQTVSFNKKQKSLFESQEDLNRRLIEKENEGLLKGKKAELGATFIKIGSNSHRLKVWNKGSSAARNVRIEFPEGNSVFIESDVSSKFPLEVLETHQSVELIAAVHLGTKSKHTIQLVWDDDAGTDNEKTVYPTL